MSGKTSLVFLGEIVKGIGRHKELTIPGRGLLVAASPDWPERLVPGSLNVHVTRYPDEFQSRRLPREVKVLDRCGFQPTFIIPQNAMRNNKLLPDEKRPRRGTAQVWRATITLDGQPETACWLLRRIGSGLGHDLELVSERELRRLLMT